MAMGMETSTSGGNSRNMQHNLCKTCCSAASGANTPCISVCEYMFIVILGMLQGLWLPPVAAQPTKGLRLVFCVALPDVPCTMPSLRHGPLETCDGGFALVCACAHCCGCDVFPAQPCFLLAVDRHTWLILFGSCWFKVYRLHTPFGFMSQVKHRSQSTQSRANGLCIARALSQDSLPLPAIGRFLLVAIVTLTA